MSGRRGKAHELLDELKDVAKSHYVSPYDMAIIYLGLGERDQTLVWLEKAYEEHEGSLVYLNVEQTFNLSVPKTPSNLKTQSLRPFVRP